MNLHNLFALRDPVCTSGMSTKQNSQNLDIFCWPYLSIIYLCMYLSIFYVTLVGTLLVRPYVPVTWQHSHNQNKTFISFYLFFYWLVCLFIKFHVVILNRIYWRMMLMMMMGNETWTVYYSYAFCSSWRHHSSCFLSRFSQCLGNAKFCNTALHFFFQVCEHLTLSSLKNIKSNVKDVTSPNKNRPSHDPLKILQTRPSWLVE